MTLVTEIVHCLLDGSSQVDLCAPPSQLSGQLNLCINPLLHRVINATAIRPLQYHPFKFILPRVAHRQRWRVKREDLDA